MKNRTPEGVAVVCRCADSAQIPTQVAAPNDSHLCDDCSNMGGLAR
jgi:hypothetical protein